MTVSSGASWHRMEECMEIQSTVLPAPADGARKTLQPCFATSLYRFCQKSHTQSVDYLLSV